ncbi:MAG: hypothetical protein CL674_12110 [Bdellovibrionaceae bacterium]|nr:hypothetical protein [Pseudobdellovibrionaceae bacterium]|tara:strand:- start:139011 stop:139811 length:801 start_codon:yes stop_codon:yes gene_type:complete
MESNETYYIQKIKEELSLRQRKNPSYSLRSYARDLGMHSSSLSQVLHRKRNLPFSKAQSVVQALDLNEEERTLFLNSFYRSKTKIDDIDISELQKSYIVKNTHHKVLAEWEHFAVTELFDLNDFLVTKESISKKLGIALNRADVVLQNLEDAGLLKYDTTSSQYHRIHENISTTEDVSNSALKQSHKEILEIASNKLEEIPLEFRDFSSVNMAVDPSKITEVKSIIREFRQKMLALLRDGEKKDVYQLSIQFFPLSVLEENTDEKK